MRPRSIAIASLIATGTPVLGACGPMLPAAERIANTRPLALRMEVQDPAADPTEAIRAEALPLETVEFVPFVVEPTGPIDDAAVLDPVWLACVLAPGEPLTGCLRNAQPLELDAIEDCPAPDLGDIDDPENLPETPRPCRITGGTPGRPQFVVPLDFNFLLGGDVEVTMLGTSDPGVSTERCADAFLGQANSIPQECRFVVQRLPIGPDAALLQLAVDLGIDIGDAVGPIPDEIPDADRNPRIQTFDVTVLDGEGNVLETVETQPGSTISAPYGGQLDIDTLASEDDLQFYLLPQDSVTFVETQEAYDGRWFKTWGTLLSTTSNDPVSFNSIALIADEQDDERPEGDRAILYYVLRDGRAGVDWWWIDVELTGDPVF